MGLSPTPKHCYNPRFPAGIPPRDGRGRDLVARTRAALRRRLERRRQPTQFAAHQKPWRLAAACYSTHRRTASRRHLLGGGVRARLGSALRAEAVAVGPGRAQLGLHADEAEQRCHVGPREGCRVRAAPGRKVKEARVLGHSVHRRELRPALRVDGGDKQGKRHLVSGVDQLVQPSQVRLELLSMLHASHHRVSNMRSTSSGPPITSATLSSSSSRRRCAKTESTANSAISRPPRVFHRLGGQ